jgi:hypothetical protein
MIFSWNETEMPSNGKTVLKGPRGVNICNRLTGEYLGPVIWMDFDTGEYESRMVIAGKKSDFIEHGRIAPENIRVFKRMPDGSNGPELGSIYLASGRGAPEAPKVLQVIEFGDECG